MSGEREIRPAVQLAGPRPPTRQARLTSPSPLASPSPPSACARAPRPRSPSPARLASLALAWLVASALCSLCGCGAGARRSKGAAPPPPTVNLGWLPVVGIVRTFMRFGENPVAFILSQYLELGNCFTLPVGFGFNFTFLIGPEAHAAFYAGKDEQLSQNEPYKFMTPIFGKGVVFDAPQHIKAQQLRFIKDSIKTSSLQAYVPEIVREAEAYFAGWGDEGECDLLEKMAELTINTASRCLLGREVREQFAANFASLFHDIDEGISPLAIINPNLPIPAFRRRDAARAKFAEIFSGIIAARRKAEREGRAREGPSDLLAGFMAAEYRDGSKLTDDQITGMLLGALFAGQHTSSITSTWLALKVVEQPALFERVMAEQRHAVGAEAYARVADAGSFGLSYAAVNEMDLLHLCMKEVLRMYPPLIMLMRQVKPYSNSQGEPVPLRVGPYEVPVGHYVFASPAVSMNLPPGKRSKGFDADDSVYSSPEKFDPDRFSDARREDARAWSYTAFGGGLHACLGEQFGFLQVKTIVSVLLREFDIKLLSPAPSPNYRAMVVGPTQPLRLRYKRRTAAHAPKVDYAPVNPPPAAANPAIAK